MKDENEIIIGYVRKNPSASFRDIAEKCGLSHTTVKMRILEMVATGDIRKIPQQPKYEVLRK